MLIDQVVDSVELVWEAKCSDMVLCAFINAIDVVETEDILGLLIATFKLGSSEVTDSDTYLSDLVVDFN